MTRFLLDTDHVSAHERGHSHLRVRFVSLPRESLAVSVITVEEMIRGRMAILARRLEPAARVRAYAKFLETVRFFETISVVPFDSACEERCQILRASGLRIGTQDLRIAATALCNDLVLVTRNRRDFERVPGLVVDDWCAD